MRRNYLSLLSYFTLSVSNVISKIVNKYKFFGIMHLWKCVNQKFLGHVYNYYPCLFSPLSFFLCECLYFSLFFFLSSKLILNYCVLEMRYIFSHLLYFLKIFTLFWRYMNHLWVEHTLKSIWLSVMEYWVSLGKGWWDSARTTCWLLTGSEIMPAATLERVSAKENKLEVLRLME